MHIECTLNVHWMHIETFYKAWCLEHIEHFEYFEYFEHFEHIEHFE